MRCRLIAAVILTVGAGCGDGSEPIDPLDPELVRELAVAQGSASGDAHAGSHELTLRLDSCDCPSVEYEGQSIDLCTIGSVGTLAAELSEGSGVLAISTELGLFTGAIEANGSFVVAGITDLSTLVGPLEAVRRMDGNFSDAGDSAEGWAGQRLIGELPNQSIDCRWIGSFALART
jgi:hypothetical protein